MTIHDIAIRIDKHLSKDTKAFLKDLNKPCIKYIWFKEKKKKSGMIHYHGRLHIESNITLESYEKKLRRELRKFYKNSKMINPWWVGKVESVYKYNRYIAKEKDVYKSNWSEEEIKSVLEDVKKIEIEKKTPMKQQLLESWLSIDDIEETEVSTILSKAYKFVFNYHVSRGYLPPTKTLLQQYVMYILAKSNISVEFLLSQVYSLN